jgi:KaiC/GvpD/RAD55 family RecA-like ATPase
MDSEAEGVNDDITMPQEMLDFFRGKSGRSLLIKGSAGAGKTIFALQLMEKFTEIDNSFYLTTRISDDVMYSHFPWLEEKEWRDRLVDVSRGFLDAISFARQEVDIEEEVDEKQESLDKGLRGAKEMLEALHLRSAPRNVDRARLKGLLRLKDLPELEHIYDRIETRLPKPSLLVIDSIEGLAEKYKLSSHKLITAMQKDLVEHSGTSLVVVVEKIGDTSLDYLVDGVITFDDEFRDGRRARRLTFKKMRGVGLKRPLYPFTLGGGRFRHFEPFEPKMHLFKEFHEPLRDTKGSELHAQGIFSSGTENLDSLLKGGYPHGSFVLVELGQHVPAIGVSYILGPTIENFLSQNRGVISVIAEGQTPDMAKDIYEKVVGEEKVRNYVRFFKVKGIEKEKEKPWLVIVDIEGCGDYIQSWEKLYRSMRKETEKAVLVTCNWDSIEAGFLPEDVEKIATSQISLSKSSKDLNFGIVKPGLKITQKLRNMADINLKIENIMGAIMLYGEKPRTEIFNIGLDARSKHPHLKLTPMV